MTKEQEKAIKVLEQYKHECIEEYKVELDDKKYTDEQHASYLHQQIEAVHIVLSMLKEKDVEIERLEKQSKNLDKQAQQYFEQTIYLDKQINLMTEVIYRRTNYKELNKYCNKKDKNKCESYTECYKCIKQYFERKVKE